MNIISAIKDDQLFRPFLADKFDDLSSWYNWFAALRCLYGLHPIPIPRSEVVRRCTGRDVKTMPPAGFKTALFLTGRRSGKSRIAAVIGAAEAVLAGHEEKLSPGEKGVVAIVSPTRRQSGIVKNYIRSIFEAPLLKTAIVNENRNGFELDNDVVIEILAGDWRTVRGHTLLAAIVDEAAFLGLDEESKVRSDTELMRALKPSLATTGGRLIAITSPYARKGWCWTTYKRHHGNSAGKVLVWNSPSRVMNETLPQSVVDEAMEEDPQAAASEYGGIFRDDVGIFIPRELLEALVVPGRYELAPREGTKYTAFIDMSGGRGDDAAVAICHREERTVILDYVKRYRPPFNPLEVVRSISQELKRYNVRRATGDRYAAEYCVGACKLHGIRYENADLNKSELYLELLPRLCSQEAELLDNKVLIDQLAALERRTRSGGKDVVDHPPGGHDDLANACAGCVVQAFTKRRVCGGLTPSFPETVTTA